MSDEDDTEMPNLSVLGRDLCLDRLVYYSVTIFCTLQYRRLKKSLKSFLRGKPTFNSIINSFMTCANFD